MRGLMSALLQLRPNWRAATKRRVWLHCLFDHLVGGHEQRLRHGETERLCALEFYRHLELGRCLHRKLGWLDTSENAIDIPLRTPKQIDRVESRMKSACEDHIGGQVHEFCRIPPVGMDLQRCFTV